MKRETICIMTRRFIIVRTERWICGSIIAAELIS